MVSLARRSSAAFERWLSRFWRLPEAFQRLSAVICSPDSHITFAGSVLEINASYHMASPSRHVSDNLLPFFMANLVSSTGLDPHLQLFSPHLQPSTGDSDAL